MLGAFLWDDLDRISDPRSFRLWCIEGTDDSVTRVDSSIPLMHHDPSDLGSLIPACPIDEIRSWIANRHN